VKEGQNRPKYQTKNLQAKWTKKSQKNANKPNKISTGQSAFKKAKFQLFGLEKCQMATLHSSCVRGLQVSRIYGHSIII